MRDKSPTMRIRFYWIILFSMIYSAVAAQSLLDKADSLEIQYRFYVMKDSGIIYLTSVGSIERQFPGIAFKSVECDRNSGLTSVEGRVDVCCFEILVAKTQGDDKLVNIRRFGETRQIDEVLKGKRFTGKFTIKAQFGPDDVILIGRPGTLYWGAALVPIGKIFAR
jgi:hypothetical protein